MLASCTMLVTLSTRAFLESDSKHSVPTDGVSAQAVRRNTGKVGTLDLGYTAKFFEQVEAE